MFQIIAILVMLNAQQEKAILSDEKYLTRSDCELALPLAKETLEIKLRQYSISIKTIDCIQTEQGKGI